MLLKALTSLIKSLGLLLARKRLTAYRAKWLQHKQSMASFLRYMTRDVGFKLN